MIINCRPSSSPPKYKVKWIKKGKFKHLDTDHEKTLNTFADANGFAIGMMKRGIFVYPLEKLS